MKYLSFDPAVKNLGYAKMAIGDKINDLEFGLIDLCPKKKVKSCTFDFLIDALFKELDKLNIDDVDIVLIECQPAMMNPLSKSLSVAIYSYFHLKNKETKLVSPCRKLGTAGKKLTYAQKKAESVRQCFELISNGDKIKIQDFRKQADIADAIMQAYAFHNAKKK